MIKSTKCSEIAVAELRYNAIPHILLAILLLTLTPLVFGITGLDSQASATPLEMSVVLVGVLLITPIFAPEQNRDIRDVVESKYLDHDGVYMIRAVMAIVLTLIMVSLFVVIMKFNGCDVGLSHVLHTFSSSLFLGGIGFMASGLSDNLTVGYMSAMLYYALNLTGAGKYLGAFCLFSMTYKDVRWKPWLLAFGVLFIVITFVVRGVMKRRR